MVFLKLPKLALLVILLGIILQRRMVDTVKDQVTLSAVTSYLISTFREGQTNPRRVSFSLAFALVFLFFSYFAIACTSFILHLVKHKEKTFKM